MPDIQILGYNAAGLYSVEISCKNFVCGGVLEGWRATLENQGVSEEIDSDGDAIAHRSDPAMLEAGENNSDIDFGFYRCPATRKGIMDARDSTTAISLDSIEMTGKTAVHATTS